MSSVELLKTAGLLGVLVLFGGGYGVLYAVGRLRRQRLWLRGGFACYAVQVLIAAVLVATSPLALGWKALIVFSVLAYLAIPPVTWRYLERTHHDEGEAYDS